MKNKLKRARWYTSWVLLGFCIFFSCTDRIWEIQTSSVKQEKRNKHKNEELTTATAKEWYQANYDPVVTTRSSVTDSTKRMLMPYWDKAKESNRRRYEVVEIPIKTKGSHLILDAETAQKWQPGIEDKAIRNTTKIVIEKDKKTGKIRSFIMTFVGSYNYLHKTHTMGKNSYLYRQSDFDGYVFFQELNGAFVNGWRYEKGKITGTISPLQEGEATGKKKASSSNTRVMVENCYDDCFTYYDQECFNETHSEYDAEFGEQWVIVTHCIPISYEECRRVCDYYDDGTTEDNDDNWEDDYPSGGSGTPGGGTTPPSGNVDDTPDIDPTYTQRDADQVVKEITAFLKALGIDITKYDIRLNTDVCESNARTLPDGTIEICVQFFSYTMKEQSSIIWHEDYHCTHGHNKTPEGRVRIEKEEDYIHLTPDAETKKYMDCFYRWRYKELEAQLEFFLPEILSGELTQTYVRSAQWYKNEIETYKAELNNGIEKSNYYEAELRFLLWKHEKMLEIVNSKK